MPRLLVIGLDGATLDLVRPWAAAGRLPVLARLMAAGAWGPLRSTLPAATFPAWTSLVTGVNPGRHGVLDFTERVPGTYRVRFVNGSYRRVPALWTRLSAAGRRVAVLTVPATYPPEPTCGVMVSGFDSPLATAIDGSFVHPRALYREIQRAVGRVPFADFQEVTTGPGWHAVALARLLEGVERRTKLAAWLLERERWDALMVVFGESDTVAHHFWRFHDPRSPRHAPSPFAGAIACVYAALDRALGALLAAAPPDTAVAIVSDHGSGGASDRVVHLKQQASRQLAQLREVLIRAARFIRCRHDACRQKRKRQHGAAPCAAIRRRDRDLQSRWSASRRRTRLRHGDDPARAQNFRPRQRLRRRSEAPGRGCRGHRRPRRAVRGRGRRRRHGRSGVGRSRPPRTGGARPRWRRGGPPPGRGRGCD